MKKKVYFFTHFSFSFSLVDVTEITILKNNRKSFEIPTLLSLDWWKPYEKTIYDINWPHVLEPHATKETPQT